MSMVSRQFISKLTDGLFFPLTNKQIFSPDMIKIHSKARSDILTSWLLLGIGYSTVTMVIWLTSDVLLKAGPRGPVVILCLVVLWVMVYSGLLIA